MSRRASTRLSETQLAAVQFLLYRRRLPLTNNPTSVKAINYSTAWALEEAGLACTFFDGSRIPMQEYVKLLPPAKQIVALGRKMGRPR